MGCDTEKQAPERGPEAKDGHARSGYDEGDERGIPVACIGE
jgi:hypothetical protein